MSMQAMVISAVKESLEELLSGEIPSLKDMVEASNTSILKLSNALGRRCGEMQVSNRAATDDIATCLDAGENDIARRQREETEHTSGRPERTHRGF